MWLKIQQMALNPLNKTRTTQNSQFNKCTQCIYQKGEYIRKSSRCGILNSTLLFTFYGIK